MRHVTRTKHKEPDAVRPKARPNKQLRQGIIALSRTPLALVDLAIRAVAVECVRSWKVPLFPRSMVGRADISFWLHIFDRIAGFTKQNRPKQS